MFNLVINIIEAFIFPLFISYYFKISHKKIYILVSGTIQLIFLNIFTYLENSSYLLTILIILINIISLYIVNKKINFNNIFIIILFD